MHIEIRKEKPSEYFAVESLVRRAFWNVYQPGCNEHFLTHKLRDDEAYLPEISRVAVLDGRIVAMIMYSKAIVTDGNKEYPVLTFGPLCVEPKYQKRGIGGRLLEATMKLATRAGYKAIIIFGEPDYYPRHGFTTCDKFGITTSDGKNFPAFMGKELVPDGLKEIKGKFCEAKVFSRIDEKECAKFDELFPYMEKLVLEGQLK